nr:hypothetical protein [Tanacetum cinerariifolium]
ESSLCALQNDAAGSSSTPAEKKKDKVDDDNTPGYTWLNDFVDATKDLDEDKIQEGSTIMFAKKLNEILKKEKLTKSGSQRSWI